MIDWEMQDAEQQALDVLALVRIAAHAADPEQALDDWLDEATEEDTMHIRWVFGAWHIIRTLNSLELEKLRVRVEQRLASLGSGH